MTYNQFVLFCSDIHNRDQVIGKALLRYATEISHRLDSFPGQQYPEAQCASCYSTFLPKRFSSSEQSTMYRLLKILAFACCIVNAASVCSTSKYNQGPRDWLQCSSSNIIEVKSKLTLNLITVSVSGSSIPEIGDFTFVQNASTIENLNFHDCGINSIGNQGFRGLSILKKLSLPYNNLTNLKATWFDDLPNLVQLDLSFNRISYLDPTIYFHLSKLQRLDINDNILTCIPTQNLENIRHLKNIRIQENPLTYQCRARITLWLKNHKVDYATNEDKYRWLDGILWQCLSDLPTDQFADRRMNTCVVSNMFDQLSTILRSSASLATSTQECVPARQTLTQCLQSRNVNKNGDVLMNLLALTHNLAKIPH
ncbi:leucine-rich repeat transmembrane neuronal protein 3-like [Athalia rosae]|uniref:leucine-rich repeat transmembrane neuronal protein 3-like n=1 Tax=Athalia rosae TaxID=37344 RepID=UPI0020337FCE|nr:leucine-rich repeat transmembrane neuronal protein 3-like [Athalia rosae]